MKTLLLTIILVAVARARADEPAYSRKEVIHGRKFGTALTMDVFSPNRSVNGAAIIFAVSESMNTCPTLWCGFTSI